jgi:hypothetical protein
VEVAQTPVFARHCHACHIMLMTVRFHVTHLKHETDGINTIVITPIRLFPLPNGPDHLGELAVNVPYGCKDAALSCFAGWFDLSHDSGLLSSFDATVKIYNQSIFIYRLALSDPLASTLL